jgi:hypothetical protein
MDNLRRGRKPATMGARATFRRLGCRGLLRHALRPGAPLFYGRKCNPVALERQLDVTLERDLAGVAAPFQPYRTSGANGSREAGCTLSVKALPYLISHQKK